MKKFLPLLLAIAMPLTAYGDSDDVSGITIYPHIGWTDGSDIDNDNHFGIGVGYRFNSPWGIEVVYQNSDAEVDGAPGGDADYDTWRLDGLYHVDSGQSWKPFLSFGVGRSEYDYDNLSDDSETQLNVGLGINFPMNDNPLQGQSSFSGADGGSVAGSWGTSQINLTSLGITPNDVIRLRWELGTDGCNGFNHFALL